MSDFMISIISGLISGAVVSLVFYLLSGRDLRKEVVELRRINGVVLQAIRDANAEVEYDENGAPIRLHFHLKADAATFSNSGGDAVMTHRDADGKMISQG